MRYARMLPLVIQIEKLKEHTAETCAFAQSPVRLGRNPLNDIELDDGYVSQWHGVIRFDEKTTTYLDLGSTNPSVVDGKPVERNVEIPVTEATDLRVGSFRIHVIRADAPQELFGARRKTAFARTGMGDSSSVAATMFFGGEPTKMRSKSAMQELVASGRPPVGSLSGPPPASAPPPVDRPSGGNAVPRASHDWPSGNVSQPPILPQPPVHVRPSGQVPVHASHPPPIAITGEPGRSGPPRTSGSPPPLPAKGVGVPVLTTSMRIATSSSAPQPQPNAAVSVPKQSTAPPVRQESQSQPIAVGGTQDSLRAAYENYRQAWRQLLAELRYRLERAGTGRRSELLDHLVQEYPDIGRESEFRTLISELGISPLRTGVPEMEDWLRRLTDNMFPPPNSGINVALAMERIGEVLEVFATAYVEMRDAHVRFCDEMSLEKPPGDSILQTTKNPRLALAYLLNPSSEGASKVEELARSMADFALHQVALVSAVVEGARGVLKELSPDVIDPTVKGGKKKKAGLFGGLFSNEAQEHWQKYRALFSEMMDEDRFTRRLFARPFARKYYAIMGGRRSLTPTG